MQRDGRRDDERDKKEDGIVMIKVDSITLGALSELFINLSAGWFLAATLVPFSQDKISVVAKIVLLTIDIVLGIVFLVFGIKIRRLEKKYAR